MSSAAAKLPWRRVAVVTGSSSGIGRAIALELARAGAAVVVHARASHHAAAAVAAEIAELGSPAEVILADVADPAARRELVARAWGWRGGVDVWINNAGADLLTTAARHWEFERKLQLLWQVDVAGTIELARQVGARMQQAGGGVILNMGWDQAQWGMEGESGQLFAAAKGAVMAFTKSLACSLAPQVRVNCLAPGWIKTAWGQEASEAWQRRAAGESWLGRWGTPEEVARAARWLVSDDASYVHGQVLAINGCFRQA